LTGDEHIVVGRTAEVGALRAFVDSVAHAPALLVLEGEVGIGKSALWNEGLRYAGGCEYDVMSCRPVQSEAQLSFTALSDLLGGVPSSAFDVLPSPQRKALEVALMLAEPEVDEPHPLAVGLALVGLLRGLAADRPVIIGIDDCHWLDHASRRVLAFALRRFHRERIGLLATTRAAADTTLVDDIVGAGQSVTVRRLGALPSADLEQILRRRLGDALSRRALGRVEKSAGGNPLFAIQIAQALVERGTSDDNVDLPLPASLQQMVGERLADLGPGLSVVQAAAATARPTVALISQLFGQREGPDGIRAAVEAGVLVGDGDRLAFTHPLLASAAYSRLERDERFRLHTRLAALLDDVEERARHLALASDEPSTEVAAALDVAARRARARCAPDTAAELWDAAARHSPADQLDNASERRLHAAQCRFEAGEVERARSILEDILRVVPHGSIRSKALTRWAWMVAHIDGYTAGIDAFRTALREVEGDTPSEFEALVGLAWSLHEPGDLESAGIAARRALALAERAGDSKLTGAATTLTAFFEGLAGKGLAVETVRRVVEAGEFGDSPEMLVRPDWLHGMLLEWDDDLERARTHFLRIHKEATDRGDEPSLPFVLYHVSRTELLMGQWDSARLHAEACAETTASTGQASEQPFACVVMALIRAHFGEVDEAMTEITRGLELADRYAVLPAAMELLATRGFLELSLGQFSSADRTFSELTALTTNSGFREPALFRFHGDAIEAKITLGHLEAGAELLNEARQLATVLDRQWLHLIVARNTGLLEAARGDLDAATATLAAALDGDRLGQPFERARTQLALGSVHRRNRKKRAGHDALTAASDVFQRLGARLWVERASNELTRIGGRASIAGLTPTELRVAELIADGRTYREAAAELFISPKTVQWNLSKVYNKLGIRSRAELPGRLGRG